MSEFDRDTAVEASERGSWNAQFSPKLTGFGGIHGGYVAATALRAACQSGAAAGRPLRMLSIQFLAPVEPGALKLVSDVESAGRSMKLVSLRAEQETGLRALVRVLFGEGRPAVQYPASPPPQLPPPELCSPLLEKSAPEAEAGLLVEHRPAAAPLPLSGGDRAEIAVWMRVAENPSLDASTATMLADAGPPALYGHLDRFVAMPSVSITIYYAVSSARMGGNWVLAMLRTRWAQDGYAFEEGELWSEAGQLLLCVNQVRRVVGTGSSE